MASETGAWLPGRRPRSFGADTHLDWLLAGHDLLAKAGLDGVDLGGSSVGASMAVERAALWPTSVRRLALIAPISLSTQSAPSNSGIAVRAAQQGHQGLDALATLSAAATGGVDAARFDGAGRHSGLFHLAIGQRIAKTDIHGVASSPGRERRPPTDW